MDLEKAINVIISTRIPGTVEVHGENIGDQGAHKIAEALARQDLLLKLLLSNNNIGDEGLRALITKSPYYHGRPILLDLGSNRITDQGLIILAELLQRTQNNIELSLFYNKITYLGVAALSSAIAFSLKSNTRAIALYLGSNAIGDEGAQSLSEIIEYSNAPLTIEIAHCGITDLGAYYIASAISSIHPTLKLRLESNKIGDEGAKALAEAIKTVTRTIHLSLAFNKIGPSGEQALEDAQRANPSNVVLNLHNTIDATNHTEQAEATQDDGDDKPDDNGGAVAQNEMANEQPTHQNSTSYFVETEVEFVELIETNATTIEPTKEEQEYLEAVEEALQRVEKEVSFNHEFFEDHAPEIFTTSSHEFALPHAEIGSVLHIIDL